MDTPPEVRPVPLPGGADFPPRRKESAMFTIAFLTRRIDGMTVEKFFEHYRTTHYDLASRMPGLVSYQQTHLRHDPGKWTLPGMLHDYDALSIYTFESYEAATAAFASTEGKLVDEDTGKFIDWPSVLAIPGEVSQRFEAVPSLENRCGTAAAHGPDLISSWTRDASILTETPAGSSAVVSRRPAWPSPAIAEVDAQTDRGRGQKQDGCNDQAGLHARNETGAVGNQGTKDRDGDRTTDLAENVEHGSRGAGLRRGHAGQDQPGGRRHGQRSACADRCDEQGSEQR
jgi:uncharacterized protein (TIGR02118 family)